MIVNIENHWLSADDNRQNRTIKDLARVIQ